MSTAVEQRPFERSFEQRMKALGHANEIRSHRARLKRDLKARRIMVADLIEDPMCDTMKAFDALLALPKWGRVKANKTMKMLHISPSRTLGGLSERQRSELVSVLSQQGR